MPAELTLYLATENGAEQPIAVAHNSFSIGRGEGNDLVVQDAGTSRRHALITFFNNTPQVTDCGSANGTFVNGKPISGSANLQHGDILMLGETCRFRVQLRAASALPNVPAPRQTPAPIPVATPNHLSPAYAATQSLPQRKILPISPLLLAGGAVGIIVLIAIIGVAVVAFKKNSSGAGAQVNAAPSFIPDFSVTPNASPSSDLPSTPAIAANGANDAFERKAVQVIRKISADTTYPFTPTMLEAIKRHADQMDGARVQAAMKSVEGRGGAVAAEARNQGIPPELVFYLGLAATSGGQNGDALAAARQAIPEVASLRAHFGTGLADYSLIVVAATKIPGDNKRSHPLLACMRSKLKDPRMDRNIWFLRESGCLSEGAYEFALKFLACGVLAQ